MQLFTSDGYGQTSMSGIAAALGGSKATLYKYFSSKEALFESAMVQCCQDVYAEFPARKFSRIDVLDFLNQVGLAVVEGMLRPRALEISRLVLSEGARHPEIARIFYSKAVEPVHALIADGLSHFNLSGQIVCPAPLVSARLYLGMIRGDVHLRALCGLEQFPEDKVLRDHVALAAVSFVAGIASASPDTVR